MYQPGAALNLRFSHADVAGSDDGFIAVTVAKTSADPDYFGARSAHPNLGPTPAPDFAIVTLTSDAVAKLASIPTATIDTNPVNPGDPVVIMGYGCETSLDATFDYAHARLKSQPVVAESVGQAIQPDLTPAPDPAAHIENNYFFTPGAASNMTPNGASLCPGDSGGPVYRDDGKGLTVVGVNSYYNFDTAHPDVAVNNWHTRLDGQAGAGVAAFIASQLAADPKGTTDAGSHVSVDAGG
jgi:hypothetical protein